MIETMKVNPDTTEGKRCFVGRLRTPVKNYDLEEQAFYLKDNTFFIDESVLNNYGIKVEIKKEAFTQPVLTITDIEWDIDIDETLDKLDNMSSDKAAEYLGVPKETYANMTTSERHDYAYDVWHHNRKSLSEFVGAPNEVTLPTTRIWDEDSISDYLSDEYGWSCEGFRITCNCSIGEMKTRVKDIQTEIDKLNAVITLMKGEEKG